MSLSRKHATPWLAVALATTVLVGCGASGTDSSTASSTSTSTSTSSSTDDGSTSTGSPTTDDAPGTPDAEIDPTAVLRVTASSPMQNLDPAQLTPGGYAYATLFYDRLIMVGPDDDLVPGLATEWTFAEDGSYLELTLREGVTFHDGTPFDAEAVVKNIERGQTLESSTVRNDLKDVIGVTAVDPTTVRLELEPGSGAVLPSALATAAGMIVSPTALDAGADLMNGPGLAGSGPYVVKEFVPNERLVVEKAPQASWDPQAGRLAGMEIVRIPEASTRLNGVKSGQTDLTFVSSANEVVEAEMLGQSGQYVTDLTPFRNVLGVLLRADRGDLAKPEVRQAMAKAIDPEAISALFSGKCTPTRSLYPNSPWSDPAAVYPYEYDRAGAASLIESVGGASVTITYSAGTNTEMPANAIQAALTEAGFEADLNPTPNAETEARFIAGDFELEVSNTFNPRLDPAGTVANYLTGNYALAPDPSVVAPIAAQAADPRLSVEERAPLYHSLWKTLFEEAWFIPLCSLTVATISTPNVIGAGDLPWVNLGLFDLRTLAMTP